MILAGDIGATRTRLAAFETEGNRLQCVVEKIYMSQQHDGLAGILTEFIKTEGIPVHSACVGVAGPVRGGRSKISNLPWIIDSRDLAKQLKLNSVGLLNDLLRRFRAGGKGLGPELHGSEVAHRADDHGVGGKKQVEAPG